VSEQTATPKLAEALAKANLAIHNPSFDKENPHFRSRFASLAAVRNALVPEYAKVGLSVLQDLQTTDAGAVLCFTTLLHSSGEERTLGPLRIVPSKQDAQGIAAAGTYAKRIHLQAVACVVGDDDDDGETASGRPETGSVTRQRAPADPRGDNRGPVDATLVAQYVERFRRAADNPDDNAAAVDVFAIHSEVSANHDLYIAIGDALGSKYKNAIRKFVDIAKKKAA
jgi:hypothetical protein